MINPTPTGEPRGREPDGHLDDVTAMRLADGERVAPPAASHATRCVLCASLVAAFRVESQALASAFSLDDAELRFLSQAQVPAQVASVASGRAQFSFLHVPRDTPASLLPILLVATGGYIVWWFAQPLLATALSLARRSGVTDVAVQYVTSQAFNLLWFLWSAFLAIGEVQLLHQPTVPLLVIAVLTWLAMWLMPLPRPHLAQRT
ncbi:MAG TPA: hypothetical protein VHS99_04430 [Chloroflexota bacterium]|jgi:hypothetical protein|nr:hypothetical protein [Chloroflexota bacterium]